MSGSSNTGHPPLPPYTSPDCSQCIAYDLRSLFFLPNRLCSYSSLVQQLLEMPFHLGSLCMHWTQSDQRTFLGHMLGMFHPKLRLQRWRIFLFGNANIWSQSMLQCRHYTFLANIRRSLLCLSRQNTSPFGNLHICWHHCWSIAP